MEIEPIAYIKTDFKEKFGIPRQSSLASNTVGKITFKKEFRNSDALKGLEGFSHLWLIWEFSANSNKSDGWSPLVRPPRLGGNTYMGVFATRSPFRPNSLGLSCVKIHSIDFDSPDGPFIYVMGADMMDGTPIYDIKPYIKYADSHPDALCGYADEIPKNTLEVKLSEKIKETFKDADFINTLTEVLQLDPRPSYHNDPNRIYGMLYGNYNVKFTVKEDILEIIEIQLV
jgi:tRNA-Thr(GGU) m(6)t(6)A37 methyltransferase TsaA